METTSTGAGDKRGRWINAVLYIEVVAASIVGFVPLALFLGAQFVPLIHAAGVAVIALLLIARNPEGPRSLPSPGEWILSGLSTLYLAAIAGLYGFIAYGLVYGGVELVALAVRLFGPDFRPDAHAVAMWPGAVFGVLFGWIMTYPGFVAVKTTLFSQQPGLRSPYYALVTDKRWLKAVAYWVVGILSVSLLIAYFFGWHATAVSLALEVFLLFVCQTPAFAVRSQHAPNELASISAVAKLAQNAGFTTVVSMPRIGDPEVDQLLSTVQLFAGNDTEAFLAEIKTSHETADPVSADAGVLLPIVAETLAERLRSTGAPGMNVIPVIVLIGRKPTPSLWALAELEDVEVVEIPVELVNEIVRTQDGKKLREYAVEFLRFANRAALPESPPYQPVSQ